MLSKTLTCQLKTPSKSYDIEIGNGLIANSQDYLKQLGLQFAIISDDKVGPLYGQELKRQLLAIGLNTNLLIFPHGEQHKTRQTKEMLEDQLFEMDFGRGACIVALGGGVVTDLSGYLAATFCRGVPLVTMPTTLLGMVDASIGGKTAVNVPFGKNLLGCIYQPKKVIMDLLTLKSLPKREWTNGLVEMIKHGIIADREYFDFLEMHASQLQKQDSAILETAIWKSCHIKAGIVEQDENEQGLRRILNFGHTIGHALETLTHYSLPHGEAVAIGILVEGYLSQLLGFLPERSFDRIKNVLVKYEVPLKLPEQFSLEALMIAMKRDKKSLLGNPRFIVIEDIGIPGQKYFTTVDEHLLKKALQWMNHDLYSC